jgi:hypothetical protein
VDVGDRVARRLLAASAALLLVLLVTGCGSDDGAGVRTADGGTQSGSGAGSASGSSPGSGSAAVACKPVGDAAKADAKVPVELTEWSVTPRPPSVKAGTITFDAANTGADAHELVVVRADDPAALPKTADGIVDESKLPAGALVGEIEAFPAKGSCQGTFELAAGRYALFCNLLETEADGTKENHFANGMRTAFEVTS